VVFEAWKCDYLQGQRTSNFVLKLHARAPQRRTFSAQAKLRPKWSRDGLFHSTSFGSGGVSREVNGIWQGENISLPEFPLAIAQKVAIRRRCVHATPAEDIGSMYCRPWKAFLPGPESRRTQPLIDRCDLGRRRSSRRATVLRLPCIPLTNGILSRLVYSMPRLCLLFQSVTLSLMPHSYLQRVVVIIEALISRVVFGQYITGCVPNSPRVLQGYNVV